MRERIGDIIIGIINLVFGLAVLGLFIRFLFRLFGANPEAEIAEFVYTSTAPLLSPFRGLFEPYVLEPGFVFEFSTLIAIAIYLVIAWLLVELIAFVTYHSRNTYRREK